MRTHFTHRIETEALTKLLGKFPFYFKTPFMSADLRFSYMNFSNGQIVCIDANGQSHCILSLHNTWDEAGNECFDYHKLTLTATDHPGLAPNDCPDNGSILLLRAFADAPIHQIKVFEKTVYLPDTILRYDGYVVIYYGAHAIVIGTQDDMTDYLRLYFVKSTDVSSIFKEDIQEAQNRWQRKKEIAERIDFHG